MGDPCFGQGHKDDGTLLIAMEAIRLTLEYTITVENCFDFLSEEYKVLFAQADATVFQSPTWMDHIHKILLPNLEAQQYTIVIRSKQNRELLSVFPLVIQKIILGMKIIQFADFGVCDYNAIVGSNTVLELLTHNKNVLSKIGKLTGAGHLLLLRKVREDVFDISRFFKKMTKIPNDNATYNCVIGDNVETWQRQKLSKSWLKNLRRMERKFIQDVGTAEFSELRTGQQLRKAMVVIRRMHMERFGDSLMQHDVYNQFYTEYVIAAINNGDAAMYELTLDGETIATEFGFLFNNCYQGILVAVETEKYAKFSLGYQMIFRVIRNIADKGYQNFDLGLGNQDYKKRFNAEETRLYDYSLARSLSGKIIAPIYHYSKPIKNILKKYVPHVH